MLAEGGIRVPFVVSWKGKIPAGQTYDHPVIALDAAGTILPLAECPHDPAIDGVNLMPFLTGESRSAPHSYLFWRWIAQSAVREGDWKYLRGGSREYLFDLRNDKEEKNTTSWTNKRRSRTGCARDCNDGRPSSIRRGWKQRRWRQPGSSTLISTWDGKPAPSPRKRDTVLAPNFNGWVTRNGRSEVKNGSLVVQSNLNQNPFIAANGLKLQGPLRGEIRLKSDTAGSVRIAWREDEQRDFVPEHVVSVPSEPSELPTLYRLAIPTTGSYHPRPIVAATRGLRGAQHRPLNPKPVKFVRSWSFP